MYPYYGAMSGMQKVLIDKDNEKLGREQWNYYKGFRNPSVRVFFFFFPIETLLMHMLNNFLQL